MNITAPQIRAARERLQLTQQDLADMVGVSVRTAGGWERGESVPRNRMGAVVQALGLDDEADYQWGEKAVRVRLGVLARRRREELGLSREAFGERVDIGQKKTIQDFETGNRAPFALTLRKIEQGLGWRHGAIDEALESGKRAAEITLEDLDRFDRESTDRPLLGFSTPELLRELAHRLESLQKAAG